MGKYKCADCDNFMQCEYYHNRKGTSKICAEFDNSFKVIPKADYEARLKADLEAILKELQLEIECCEKSDCDYVGSDCLSQWQIDLLIQQKINALKEDKNEV